MLDEFEITDGLLRKYTGSDSEVVIPDGVEVIGNNVFENNKTVTDVVMPDSVYKIGSCAFQGCIRLKNIRFSNTLKEIGYRAFRGCKAIREIMLPETLVSADNGSFSECSRLTKISCNSKVFVAEGNPFVMPGEKFPEGIADRDGFIIFCNTLYGYVGNEKELVIPEGVTDLANSLFSLDRRKECEIEKVVLPSSLRRIGGNAFKNCRKLKEINIGKDVECGKLAFSGCDSLADENGLFVVNGIAYTYVGKSQKVKVPAGVKVLSDELFANDYGSNPGNKVIRNVILPEGLEVIGNSVFKNCEYLEKINIPDSVRSIGDNAFGKCTNLKNLKLPETVEDIKDNAFIGCKGLADEKGFVCVGKSLQCFFGSDREITVPEGIESIAEDAFSKSGIKSIKLPSTLKKLGSAFNGCDMLEEIVIPEGVERIAASTFMYCTGLRRVELPESLKSIGSSAFNGCTALKSIRLPEALEIIESTAFAGCTSLESVNIPKGVKELTYQSFMNCYALKELVLNEGLEKIGSRVFANCKSLKETVIPSTVKIIGSNAFYRCEKLKKLDFESMETIIDESAFEDCDGLKDKDGFTIVNGILLKYDGDVKDLILPEGITKIATEVFREGYKISRSRFGMCREEGSLRSIVLPESLKEIGAYCFCGCTELREIVIPDGVTKIGEAVFYYVEKLKKAVLSENTQRIENNLFNGCKALESLYIPRNVIGIGENVFGYCDSLKEIEVSADNEYYSSKDGILYDKSLEKLVYVPSGKKIEEYVIPAHVKEIADCAFAECDSLKKIVIPETVEAIGDEVFMKNGRNRKSVLKDIEIDLKAGKRRIGRNIFDFSSLGTVLVYPKLPLAFVSDQGAQMFLAFGYCLNSDKYEGEYAKQYKEYVQSHEKSLIRKALASEVKGIEEYFNKGDMTAEGKKVYKPDLNVKKPSELVKVEILEEAVLKGSLNDVEDVLKTYKTFEMTARALAMAARYRGLDFVKKLYEYGASFNYENSTGLQRKYKMLHITAGGTYYTRYYLMMVPEKLDINEHGTSYGYTPMYGVMAMNFLKEYTPLSVEKRIETVKYLMENKQDEVSLDEMLFWALCHNELSFADELISLGVNLKNTPPSHYTSWGSEMTYYELLISAPQNVYWNNYVQSICNLKAEDIRGVFERIVKITGDNKPLISGKMFECVKWNNDSLSYVLKYANISKLNQKKTLELAVEKDMMSSLEVMAEMGWLANSKKREELIEYARTNKHINALAWLLDFKNRTVDIFEEEAREEARMLKELNEDPNSVSALKRKWSFVKLQDGSLKITSYKGCETEISVPAVIGKACVSSVGDEVFSKDKSNIKNADCRKKISRVLIPEGIKTIGKRAFYNCTSLVSVVLPSSLESIGDKAFAYCEKLENISISDGVKVDARAFLGCSALADNNGLIIINNVLYSYMNSGVKNPVLTVPDGVREIGKYAFGYELSSSVPKHISEIVLPDTLKVINDGAFKSMNFSKINIPEGVEVIGSKAFSENRKITSVILPECLKYLGEEAFSYSSLREVRIPESLKVIAAQTFIGCNRLRDAYIPETVEKIGNLAFGNKSGWLKLDGVYVHTPAGSYADKYFESFEGIYVVNDYEK